MSNAFGRIFRLTTFGESHGKGIGGVLEGCPSELELDRDAIAHEMRRRRPGQSALTTQRNEADEVQILSGVLNGITLGTPIGFFIPNQDARESDYEGVEHVFRPSHADYTWFAKFGIREHRGGGRSSARETAARVFGGAVAKQFLAKACGMQVQAYVDQVADIHLPDNFILPEAFDFSADEQVRITNCPDAETARRMAEAIQVARKAGDTLGGCIRCVIRNVPAGLGEPVFDKLHAVLGHAVLSINAVKGIEFGSGFSAAAMKGSEHNDAFVSEGGVIGTQTNHSGGIQGGISNGQEITFRVAFKPVSTIMSPQETVNEKGEKVVLENKGRHDPCVLPRAVPIVEAMAALVMADMVLIGRGNRLAGGGETWWKG